MNVNPLIPVGAKIKIDKYKIKNVLSKKLLDHMPQIINCEVVDYKMTDGMGIGYVLMTYDNIKIWVFTDELNEDTKKEYKIKDISNSSNLITKDLLLSIIDVNYEMNGNKGIKTLANPFNIINWIIFSLKDIF
tara:strand:- start:2488 stop:2886 length:399 start_codon:yes stop_codon:yes gene_type:complete